MTRPGFIEGVAVALIASLAGGVLYFVLPVAPGTGALRLLITAIALGYLLYLLRRSRKRIGRVTTLAAWALAALALWWLVPSLALYALAHLGLLWLVRSLYFYASALSSLADLGLTALGFAAAVWAAVQTHSVVLAIWCLFLVQALCAAIPAHWNTRGSGVTGSAAPDRFEHAHRAAEDAVRRLSAAR
ncbi:MAG: hypothetical protein IT495_16930 [Gammaproteobacteria bacterium]|nr:hypothetical protein [Gammaproteobacteria bacterium]